MVAITGISPVDDSFRRLCQNELREYANIGVVIYGDVVGQASVFSLSQNLALQVYERIKPWPADAFGGYSTITTHRPETARRKAARGAGPSNISEKLPPLELVEIKVQHLPPKQTHFLPPMEYRFELERRLETGEPIFRWVPPYKPIGDE